MVDENNGLPADLANSDMVIESLLEDLAEFTALPPALSTAIHGDHLGFSLALVDPESGDILARASGRTFGEALSLLHGRFIEAVEEIRQGAADLEDTVRQHLREEFGYGDDEE